MGCLTEDSRLGGRLEWSLAGELRVLVEEQRHTHADRAKAVRWQRGMLNQQKEDHLSQNRSQERTMLWHSQLSHYLQNKQNNEHSFTEHWFWLLCF